MNVEELKEKARRHEQREEWRKAFDLYSAALRVQEEDESPDITLFNRLGDIQTRLGQINGAIEQYERAINLYLEAELPNNAIAVCKKVLRNLPDRNIFFLRMGQIRAGQGFLTDARQSFLTYAERETNRGETENALNALVEFVELSPEDVEIRRSLASQLESHGRHEEAVNQFQEAYRQLILTGDEEGAEEVSEKLRELAPDLALPDPESLREEALAPEVEELVLESTSLAGIELEDWRGGDVQRIEGAEVTVEPSAGDEEEGEPIPEGEAQPPLSGSSHLEEEEEEEGDQEEVLPSFDFEDEDAAATAEVLRSSDISFGEVEEPGLEESSLPLITFDDDDVSGVDEGEDVLSPIGFAHEEDSDIPADDLPFLAMGADEGEVSTSGSDAHLEESLEDGAFEAGWGAGEEDVPGAGVSPEPEVAEAARDHVEAAERGDMDLAISRVGSLLSDDPDNVGLHQRLVEYAFRKNDQEVLVSAYLSLAGCLARTGAPMKARAVFQQVLSLAPGHEEAVAGLQNLEGGLAKKTTSQVASSEEYVDLGAMILGEEEEETTRWTVAAEAPSGDDEADFAKMLVQFKEKVSEHVAVDDVGAHHDLGTAYMEMGLLDEAIGEFQLALRAAPDHLPTHEVMGRCWLQKGQPDMAVRALRRALQAEFEVEDELIGIYYLMGAAQEAQGNTAEAVEFYEKVFSLDINFEDVTERLRALR